MRNCYVNEKRRRKKCVRDKFKGALLAFNIIGDLVMVAAQDNSANPIWRNKVMVTWQGPYQVVRRASATEYDVLLLGDKPDRAKPIHWSSNDETFWGTRVRDSCGIGEGRTARQAEVVCGGVGGLERSRRWRSKWRF